MVLFSEPTQPRGELFHTLHPDIIRHFERVSLPSLTIISPGAFHMMPVVWFITPDRRRIKSSSKDVLGLGRTGLILKHGENALKIARVEDTTDYSEDDRDNYEVLNEMNIDALCNEIKIYKRLGSHPGLLQVFELTKDSIEMAIATRGSLARYIKTQDEPTDNIKTSWTKSVLSTIGYVHERSVTVDDVALRNFMIDDQLNIKLIDFGLSTLHPLGTMMLNSRATHSDIFRVAFILYSLATWKIYDYDDHKDRNPSSLSSNRKSQDSAETEFNWPLVENLPSTEGCLYGDIIRKCWIGQYNTMDQLCNDIGRSSQPDSSVG